MDIQNIVSHIPNNQDRKKSVLYINYCIVNYYNMIYICIIVINNYNL